MPHVRSTGAPLPLHAIAARQYCVSIEGKYSSIFCPISSVFQGSNFQRGKRVAPGRQDAGRRLKNGRRMLFMASEEYRQSFCTALTSVLFLYPPSGILHRGSCPCPTPAVSWTQNFFNKSFFSLQIAPLADTISPIPYLLDYIRFVTNKSYQYQTRQESGGNLWLKRAIIQ